MGEIELSAKLASVLICLASTGACAPTTPSSVKFLERTVPRVRVPVPLGGD